MDKVQIYESVMLVICTLAALARHGEEKKGHEDFRFFFVAMILSLPVIGRIYGWW